MIPAALSNDTEPIWRDRAKSGRYRRDGMPGVLHLGLGAFHRAHQAMVFDRLLDAGDDRWGVHALGMRQPALVDSLRRQDGLYLVRVADAEAIQWVVPRSLWHLGLASAAPDRVAEAVAHPALRWITLTITEKGYTAELGRWLARCLEARYASGGGGLTIASCDNLRGNGVRLQQLVLGGCADREVQRWIRDCCAFPSSMVDRIVPASSEALRQQATDELGLIDASPLGTESFWEWVIEDRFADPSDAAALRSAGVRVTDQVHVYEDAKLRMLNGSHSAMALIGAITGRACIADCIGHPPIRQFVMRLIDREVAPHLQRADWTDYRDALIRRFGNPQLRHSVHQIATDSSLKIPQRWPASILAQLQCGRGIDHHALAAAVWLRYGLGVDERGLPYEISDPQSQWLKDLAAKQRATPQACVDRLLGRPDLWGDALARDPHWHERVRYWHAALLANGADATLDRLLRELP